MTVPGREDPECVLELAGLEQRLVDPASGSSFTVHVDRELFIRRGSSVALLGPSGCGKTTLLTVLGLLRSPMFAEQGGRFVMRTPGPGGTWTEQDVRQLWLSRRRSQIERLRREHVGFALQSGELLPALTVRENIAAPLRLNSAPPAFCRARVDELLLSFGLLGARPNGDPAVGARLTIRRLEDQRINRLSGGEYQRVALARAIVHRPTLLFIDEPTSALNRELAHEALKQIRNLQCGPDSHGALVMITHDENLAGLFADVIVRMAPRRNEPVGEVVEIVANTPAAALDRKPAESFDATGPAPSAIPVEAGTADVAPSLADVPSFVAD